MKTKAPDMYILFHGDYCNDSPHGQGCPYLCTEWLVCEAFDDKEIERDIDNIEEGCPYIRCQNCKEWTNISMKYRWARPLTTDSGCHVAKCKRCRTEFLAEFLYTKNNYEICPQCKWDGTGAQDLEGS